MVEEEYVKSGEQDEKNNFTDTCEFVYVILQTMTTLLWKTYTLKEFWSSEK